MRGLRVIFLAIGTLLLLVALVVSVPDKALVMVLAGIGMMLGGIACALVEGLGRRSTQDKGVDWYR